VAGVPAPAAASSRSGAANPAIDSSPERSRPHGLKSAITLNTMNTSSQQAPESAAEAPMTRCEGFLDGGLFVAGVAIGVAPAAAAAGIMLDSRLVSYGVTGTLLLMGFVIAAVSSEL
jgi:hypothetical protein